jgi:hypothetical protein
MRVSLRKAAILERRLASATGELKLRATVEVPAFDERPMETVAAARARLMAELDRAEALDAVRYRLRAAIGRANAAAGIDELLARRAQLGAGLKRLQDQLKDAEPAEERQLVAQLKAAQRRLGEDGLLAPRRSGVEAGVLDLPAVEALHERAALVRRELDAVEDRLLALNAEHAIEIDEADVARLRAAGLV